MKIIKDIYGDIYFFYNHPARVEPIIKTRYIGHKIRISGEMEYYPVYNNWRPGSRWI
jgi:hypothetical protein